MKHFFSLMRSWPVALSILLLLAGPAARAQAPAWQTVIAAGQSAGNSSSIAASAADASGNVYVVGSFTGAISLGSLTLSSTGDLDIFIAKWSPALNRFVWAQQAGGSLADFATAVAVNGTSIYVAGAFTSHTAAFGSTVLTNANTTPSPIGDVFVTKLTDSGTAGSFIWTQRAGSPDNEYCYGLAVNGANIYVAGDFQGTTGNFGNTMLTCAGGTDAFVAKLVDAGSSSSFVWAQRAGGLNRDRANALAVNGTSVYVVGTFGSAPADFGNTTLNSISSYYDVFVTKLTDAGTTSSFTWTKQAGGTGWDEAFGVAVNGANVYAVGEFGGTTADFGNTTLVNSGSTITYDAFVTKIIDAGSNSSFAWTQQAGGTGDDLALAVSVQATSLYVLGGFGVPTAQFGGITLSNSSSGGGPIHDLFVAKLSDAGTFVWAQQAGSSFYDDAYALTVSGTNIYAGGYVGSPASFGSQTISSPSDRIAFLASLTDPTLLAATAAQGNLSFTLYPNPARRATIVQLPALPGTTTATLTLRDALGRAVRTTTAALTAAGLRHELDLSGLPAGIYALQVQAGPATATRKLVVE